MGCRICNSCGNPAERSKSRGNLVHSMPLDGRISVVGKEGLVPLLPGPARKTPQPWTGLLLERHSVRSMEIPEHEHRDLCLHLQVTGNSDYEWWNEGKNRVEKSSPGSLIVLPAGTRDRLVWTGPSDRYLLSLKAEELAKLAEQTTGSPEVEFTPQWAAHDMALRNLVMEMGQQAENGWPLGSLYAGLLSLDLQHHLLRTYAGRPYKAPEFKGGLTRPRLRHALEFMNEHLGEDVSLEKIADELQLSPFHFARAFRISAGKTAHQYLLDRRMEEARHLLRSTRDDIAEIALHCGFQSPVNFTRTFRERVGVTPSQWRAAAG